MAINYGTLQRTYPRLRVLRGYVGQNSNQRGESAPVKDGEVIMSGMCISKLWNPTTTKYEWVRGLVSGAVPYVALQDYNDVDVLGSGSLTGLSCSGQYTFESPYFVGTTALDDGALVSAYANDDATDALRGKFKIAASTNPILGVVVRLKDGPADASGYSSNVVKDGDGQVKVFTFDAGYTGAVAA